MRAEILTSGYERCVRPVLFRMHGGDPEAIHEDMIRLLGSTVVNAMSPVIRLVCGSPREPVTVAGVHFPGRVGLAAGLDKDGLAARIWGSLGFGFAELGTVTAHAQPGNPRPRVFRLVSSHGLINRMGFNNRGAASLAERLKGWGVRRGEGSLGIPLGISIGKTKVVAVEDAVEDYLASFDAVRPFADYVAINVSSPNTPGLRTLQDSSRIHELVAALVSASRSGDEHPVPIFVKIAPDLTDSEIDSTMSAVVDAGASGVIATNTTLSREGIVGMDRRYARQAGGMSGAPLATHARRVVAKVVGSGLPVIASGGIMTADDAMAMLDEGAQLVEVYTGFIYSGPGLVAAINGR